MAAQSPVTGEDRGVRPGPVRGPDPAAPADAALQDLARLAAALCDTPFAVITIAGDAATALYAGAGCAAAPLPEVRALCDHAVSARGPLLECADLRVHPVFGTFTAVSATGGLRFYAGVALVSEREGCVGSVCVLDRRVRQLEPRQRAELQTLARVGVALIEARHAREDAAEAPLPGAGGARLRPGSAGYAQHYAVAILAVPPGLDPAAGMPWVARIEHVIRPLLEAQDVISHEVDGELIVVLAHAARARATLDRLRVAIEAVPDAPPVAIGAAVGVRGIDGMDEVFLVAEGALERARTLSPPMHFEAAPAMDA